jgi:hypothetical protein
MNRVAVIGILLVAGAVVGTVVDNVIDVDLSQANVLGMLMHKMFYLAWGAGVMWATRHW